MDRVEALGLAVRDSARWCDRVCRAHGVGTALSDGVWWAGSRPPPAYPDAATLVPGVTADEVLDVVSTGPGCSVKDSFATLDLDGQGFEVLFDAAWLYRPAAPGPTPRLRWRAVAQLRDPVLDAVAGDPAVRFVAGVDPEGEVVARAVLHDDGTAIGVSNVVAADADLDEAWRGVIALTLGRDLVGYERGPDLAAARRAGGVDVGPLRVWRRPTA